MHAPNEGSREGETGRRGQREVERPSIPILAGGSWAALPSSTCKQGSSQIKGLEPSRPPNEIFNCIERPLKGQGRVVFALHRENIELEEDIFHVSKNGFLPQRAV